MKVYEFGKEHTQSFAMFQCAVEPWWVFKASAEEMAKDYHVYLFIADGHDELGTEFVSLEKYVNDAAEYLRGKGTSRVDAMYGVSMGGAAVIRFLAAEDIPVEKAIIDAGITPYPYPKLICRLIEGHHRCRDHAVSLSETDLQADIRQGLDYDHAGDPVTSNDEARLSAGKVDTQRRGPGGALPGIAEIL